MSPVPNTFGYAVGDRFLVIAHDGGNPSAAPVDGFFASETSRNFDCKIAPDAFARNDVTQGNITVKSA